MVLPGLGALVGRLTTLQRCTVHIIPHRCCLTTLLRADTEELLSYCFFFLMPLTAWWHETVFFFNQQFYVSFWSYSDLFCLKGANHVATECKCHLDVFGCSFSLALAFKIIVGFVTAPHRLWEKLHFLSWWDNVTESAVLSSSPTNTYTCTIPLFG